MQKRAMRNISRTHRALALLTAFVLLPGCGPSEYQPSEEDRVVEAISGIADATATEESFQAAFATSSPAPEDQRLTYNEFSYDASNVVITGETATATVDVISPFTDESIAQVEWTCQREGGVWKLHTAPLPESPP